MTPDEAVSVLEGLPSEDLLHLETRLGRLLERLGRLKHNTVAKRPGSRRRTLLPVSAQFTTAPTGQIASRQNTDRQDTDRQDTVGQDTVRQDTIAYSNIGIIPPAIASTATQVRRILRAEEQHPQLTQSLPSVNLTLQAVKSKLLRLEQQMLRCLAKSPTDLVSNAVHWTVEEDFRIRHCSVVARATVDSYLMAILAALSLDKQYRASGHWALRSFVSSYPCTDKTKARHGVQLGQKLRIIEETHQGLSLGATKIIPTLRNISLDDVQPLADLLRAAFVQHLDKAELWIQQAKEAYESKIQSEARSLERLILLDNVISDAAPSIQYAITGNIEALHNLIVKGLASPRDISITRGYSMVRWALYGSLENFEMVLYLIYAGAKVDQESYDHVWDFITRNRCTDEALKHLRCITQAALCPYGSTWVEQQAFPKIHQSILAGGGPSLIEILRSDSSAVNQLDARGRTALDWATARGQVSDMKTLIEYGSSPQTVDVEGRSTILHAVDSHNDEALRIVLAAGGDPNPRVSQRSSPLNAACFGGLSNMVCMLVAHGAAIVTCNPEGRTAMQAVLDSGTGEGASCARTLLEGGGNMHEVTSHGNTVLESAIMMNKHDILRVFAEYHRLMPTEQRPSQEAIAFADVVTQEILHEAHLYAV